MNPEILLRIGAATEHKTDDELKCEYLLAREVEHEARRTGNVAGYALVLRMGNERYGEWLESVR